MSKTSVCYVVVAWDTGRMDGYTFYHKGEELLKVPSHS
jgi:hypothetical protein